MFCLLLSPSVTPASTDLNLHATQCTPYSVTVAWDNEGGGNYDMIGYGTDNWWDEVFLEVVGEWEFDGLTPGNTYLFDIYSSSGGYGFCTATTPAATPTPTPTPTPPSFVPDHPSQIPIGYKYNGFYFFGLTPLIPNSIVEYNDVNYDIEHVTPLQRRYSHFHMPWRWPPNNMQVWNPYYQTNVTVTPSMVVDYADHFYQELTQAPEYGMWWSRYPWYSVDLQQTCHSFVFGGYGLYGEPNSVGMWVADLNQMQPSRFTRIGEPVDNCVHWTFEHSYKIMWTSSYGGHDYPMGFEEVQGGCGVPYDFQFYLTYQSEAYQGLGLVGGYFLLSDY